MDVGFVILCPDRKIGGLKNTIGSIKSNAYERDFICVVGNNVFSDELKEMKKCAPTFTGSNTITSLINTGIKECKHEWAFLIFSGSRACPYIENRFFTWVKKETDVLFPVVDRKRDFVSGSFNGVLINTKFFAEVGDFPNYTMENTGMNDFELSKLLWATDAIEKGVTFKAIVGMKII